jgi:large subunit ribosomal protein L22
MAKAKKQAVRAEGEAFAVGRMIRTSPRKLALVAGAVQGLPVEAALVQLEFSKRRIAGELRQVLLSAIANAENNHNLYADDLIVKEISVGKAMVMKRFRARARGRGARILKPFSNVKVVVAETNKELN